MPPKQSFEEAKKTMSKMSLSFFSESKRVSNRRIKEELGYTLLYPSYVEGFQAQIEEEEAIMKQQQKKTKSAVSHWNLINLIFSSCKSGLVVTFLHGLVPRGLRLIRNFFHCFARFVQKKMSFFSGPKTILCLMIDNGSLRPEPTLQFRKYERLLKESNSKLPCKDNVVFKAISARHSNKIPKEKLEGKAAETLSDFVESVADYSPDRILCIPLFLSNSKTVTSFIPAALSEFLDKRGRNIPFRVSKPLVRPEKTLENLHEKLSVESILCNMILRVKESIKGTNEKCTVILVDHGSPSREVNAVRRGLAASLRIMLKDTIPTIIDCSMERREGKFYDFNEPLLESVFDIGGVDEGPVIVAYAFLAPGRHAGKGGDIEEIIDDVRTRKPSLNIYHTGLIADDENSLEFQGLLGSRLLSLL